jgi:DNA processing protein
MAERLARDLAARGLVIFSGLARGVDSAAHCGAVAGKGKTVAVFGTGVDQIYPKENSRLVDQILSLGGALISEFPLETFPAPQNFPIRNRIISGIATGVLVVEAAEYSGTRITSRCALERNREVFAVPAMLRTRIPGSRTRSSNRARNWLRLGKTFGRNSRQMCDLCWSPRRALNRRRAKQHLYSGKPS